MFDTVWVRYGPVGRGSYPHFTQYGPSKGLRSDKPQAVKMTMVGVFLVVSFLQLKRRGKREGSTFLVAPLESDTGSQERKTPRNRSLGTTHSLATTFFRYSCLD